ncbi:MAG TPA: hypothetical protein VN944_09960 [Nitrospiria bacterium]|nr:hypothetical protein [Nitrospiria bacterium]
MKTVLFLLILIGLLLQGFPVLRAEEPGSPPAGESTFLKENARESRERKAALRESEILGNLEKPRLSTEIPWHNPENLPEDLAGPRKSFIREIFRPIPALSSPETKH